MSENTTHFWQTIAAFIFGIVFISTILVITYVNPNPSSNQYGIYRTVMALAAGGIGAVLPGFLHVSFKNTLRAGGAIALFIIVYFFNPALPDNTIGPIPKKDPKVISDNWLKMVDNQQYNDAYQSMAKGFRDRYPFQQFNELISSARTSLGDSKARKYTSVQAFENIPGAPKGHYRQYVYRTKFSMETQNIYEVIWIAAESDEWKVAGFNFQIKTPSGQFTPYEPK